MKKAATVEKTEDIRLVRGALNGDRIAFGVLVEKYRRQVVGMAYAVLGNVSDAEDVAQDTFTKVFKNLRKLQDPGKFAVWLSKITYATATDVVRKKRRERMTLEKLSQEGRVRGGVEAALAENRDVTEIVMAAIAEMPQKTQVVLVMRFFDRLPYSDIADFLGTSRDVVRGLIYRGVKYLRERLGKYLR